METPLSLVEALAAGRSLPPDAAPSDWDNTHLSGIYRSVHQDSYWSDGNFPAGFSLTLTMRFATNFLHYEGRNDTRKDSLYINRFTATLDDRPGPIVGNARYNEVRIRQLSATEFQVLEQQDGDVIVGQYWCFSNNAGTLMRWGVGKSPTGSSKAFFETFRRVTDAAL